MSSLRSILDRRQMLKASAAAAAATVLPGALLGRETGSSGFPSGAGAYRGTQSIPGAPDQRYPFTLPDLPYGAGALDAAIDQQTMEIHHGRHHQGYVNGLNRALEGHPELHGWTLTELVTGWDGLPEAVRTGVRNTGGGHLNHSLFWPSLSPSGGGEPAGPLAEALRGRFTSFSGFRDAFSQAAGSVFGSGWGWLVVTPTGDLEILATPNQDNPISGGNTPLLGLDVWEHAYYLRYQNRRADYISAFWDVVDWGEIGRRFEAI
jgi:Fe-Mn family superoxide dismutase